MLMYRAFEREVVPYSYSSESSKASGVATWRSHNVHLGEYRGGNCTAREKHVVL